MQFLFGDYALDTDRRELRRGAELISTGPQVFDLLVYLVQNRERVVSKDALFEAVWAGRIVSESTLTTHINAVRKAVGDTGEEQHVIRTIPRKGFRFVCEIKSDSENIASPVGRGRPKPELPDKPSIAVLPFQNLSGDPEQEYFADGVVEDIIAALSRVRLLFVIARNSSFTYKGRAVDVKQVGRDLGVRYVLEGSVRKAANQVRIAGQLIDASTAANLWADRFDGTLEDIFNLQDQITTSVVGALLPKLEQAEIERAKQKSTESLDAYDLFLRGTASVYQGTKESNAIALDLFKQAIDRDSIFAAAYGLAAYCFVWRKTNGWMADPVHETPECARLARRAVELGRDDGVALARGGHALAYVANELDDGIAFIQRALEINPNLALAWYASGWVRIYLGDPDLAIDHLTRAMRLSPLDLEIHRMQAGMAMAHFIAGRHQEAMSWAQMALREQPNYLTALRVAAASNALAGRSMEAKKSMTRLRELDPTLRIFQSQRSSAVATASRSCPKRTRIAESWTSGIKSNVGSILEF